MFCSCSDIDDRVRYISLKMGLRPIIWTTANGNEFGKSSHSDHNRFPILTDRHHRH